MANQVPMAKQLEILNRFLESSLFNLNVKEVDDVVELKLMNGEILRGLAAISFYLLQNAAPGMTLENKALIRQWFEYRSNILDRLSSEKELTKLLQDLNAYLAKCVYLVGSRITAADVFLYLGIHPVMQQLSFQEKECYINVSRWFNTIQYRIDTLHTYPKVSFSRSLLYDGCSS